IYYADGTVLHKQLDASMVTGFDTASSGDKTLTVSYGGFDAVVEYVVEKLDPEFDIPGTIVVEYEEGLTLADLELPSGFTWANPNTVLTIGDHEYFVIYTPEDLNKYKVVIDVKVK